MLNLKHKRAIRRNVDLELGIKPPQSSIYTNKKKYNRKLKQIVLTQEEWQYALKMPTPHKNKKKYTRRVKHKHRENEDFYD